MPAVKSEEPVQTDAEPTPIRPAPFGYVVIKIYRCDMGECHYQLPILSERERGMFADHMLGVHGIELREESDG